MKQEMSFIMALQKFFGRKKDQTLKEFVAETKDLTDEDRTELRPLLEESLGITISN